LEKVKFIAVEEGRLFRSLGLVKANYEDLLVQPLVRHFLSFSLNKDEVAAVEVPQV